LFKVVTPKQRKDVRDLTDVQAYLQSVTLEVLLTQLKDKGITQTIPHVGQTLDRCDAASWQPIPPEIKWP
jgi:hypothetical protein